MINKIDNWIVDRTQRIYLWILDWTGIYIGSIAIWITVIGNLSSYLTYKVPPTLGHMTIIFCLTTPNFLISIIAYLEQDKKKFERINFRAIIFRASPFKIYWSIMLLTYLFVQFMVGEGIAQIINFPCCIVWMYLFTILVREREPKEWVRKQHLALERSS